MELNINTETVVKNVQQEFNSLYPYLKIEFLTSQKKQVGLSRVEKIAPTTLFKTLYNINRNISINVNSNRTVAEVEKDFIDAVGLSIQLYRKSGNVWIETSLTDDWTLARQNEAGEVLSFHPAQKVVN